MQCVRLHGTGMTWNGEEVGNCVYFVFGFFTSLFVLIHFVGCTCVFVLCCVVFLVCIDGVVRSCCVVFCFFGLV